MWRGARRDGRVALRRRPKYAAHAASHARHGAAGRELAARFLALADEDADAYAGFGAAMKLPRETDEEKAARTAAIREAARVAADVPLRTVEACREVVIAAEALAGRSNRNASSDLEVAARLVAASAHGAAENVYVNLPSLGDEAARRRAARPTRGAPRRRSSGSPTRPASARPSAASSRDPSSAGA